ncbi:thaumatin [Microdochium trichocladiopsis]|uniref:Thaumatin n=1 Tax=Microdochium trichocladiopsis TaxID=1682393 RepID=A0A9P8XQM5_9PEZI|nr:thaumatin [Microdochium trichocladiopsis]XP_046004566.1 thaumatin [Microdochium trichocladiopsis]KAH7009107.1 thaumatin [Microdochium trichocladiopsis]KAH7012190.1 thaumatin [Microdochium trichocladiopsis]
MQPILPGILRPNGSYTALLPDEASAGRLWARQYCEDGANCAIGDCGSSDCWSHSSDNTTLFEFTLNADTFWYDISLVDAFTCGMTVVPEVEDSLRCKTIACPYESILGTSHQPPLCPKENLILGTMTAGQATTAPYCLSDCRLYGSDEYCCRGGTPQSCQPSSTWFKNVNACPHAYSYAFDDASSLWGCDVRDVNHISVRFNCP